MSKFYDVLILGGGAAGFFTAINIAERNCKLKIAILERGKEVLSKVRVSGGGRCNVTHACYDPNDLAKNYPRGEKELRGPFHKFAAGDTIEWFKNHGVELKTESDGRMFPTTDSSQTIIDCFIESANRLKIEILMGQSVQSIFRAEEYWKIETPNQQYAAEKVVFATGSNPKIWEMLKEIGHSIIPAVPSLFTFNIKDPRIKDLPGLSAMATVSVNDSKLAAAGPLLITHWGLSGPAILKLSAWGARILHERNYQFTIKVNWLHEITLDAVENALRQLKSDHPKKLVINKPHPGDDKNAVANANLPARLWENLVQASGISAGDRWADLTKKQINQLSNQLTSSEFTVNGKSTFKEEFVTAGGIDLREVNFKTMESKLFANLYFAGEIVNVDAITGGFNFQNAWTAGHIIGSQF